jgi:pimeloyl-CoA dehydrogenase small subunit
MDFSFSDEQKLLRDSVSRFVHNDYKFEARRRIIEEDPGYSVAHWKQFAELGWLGVPFPEADGGFGGGAIESMIMMEEFGKGLVVEPFLPTVLLTGRALSIAGTPGQKETYLAGIIDGSLQGALAFAEPQGRYNLANVETAAKQDGADWLIDGYKAVVLNGGSADVLVVSVRTAGAPRDRDGVSLLVVPADANGISRREYPTVDGLRAAEITFDGVRVAGEAVLGEAGDGLGVLEQVVDEATLAVGAEAVGGMEVAYQATVEYCKTREQFGQPIGQFQVLQHRMVDMFMEYEQAKSLMYMAAMRLDEGYGPEAKKAVSAFKVQVGKSGRFVGQGAVQLHGGMGMTDELAIGHYFKRLTTIDTLFGNVDFHLKRFGGIQ